jgi:hypothetical protein
MADSGTTVADVGAVADRVAAAHQALLREPGLQFEFEAAPPPPQWPDWLLAIFRFLGGLQPVFEILFWTAIAALGGLILYFVVREVLRYYRSKASRDTGPDDVVPDWRPPAARAHALLSDADRLAAEGRFAEAVHLLLFRSIEDIDTKRPQAVKPALTSRDILDLRALPAAARQALARLVATVEWSFFGGRPVEAGDFTACRRAYEEFAFSESWADKPGE